MAVSGVGFEGGPKSTSRYALTWSRSNVALLLFDPFQNEFELRASCARTTSLSRLRGIPGPVALDTVAFIYFIEEHPRYLPLLELAFAAIDAGRLPAVTSS